MSKTDRQVVIRALKLIKVIGSDETPEADDYDDAHAEYVGCHETIMRSLRNTTASRGQWNYTSVPDEAFPFVARILAERLAVVFPITDDFVPSGDDALASLSLIYSRRKGSNDRFPNMPTTRAWPGTYTGARQR